MSTGTVQLLTCPCTFQNTKRRNQLHEAVDPVGLRRHLDDAVVGADVQHFTTKLVSEVCDVLQVLVLETQSLRRRQITWVIVGHLMRVVRLKLLRRHVLSRNGAVVSVGVSHLAVVSEEFLEVLRAENRDLREEQFALYERSAGVVQHGPDGHEILELATSLLDDAILALQHDGHAREVGDFSATNNERVDVETAGSQDTRDAREHTRLVLHQAVEDVAVTRRRAGDRRFVEDAGDCGGGRDAGGLCGGG